MTCMLQKIIIMNKGTLDGKVFDNVISCLVAEDKANMFFILSVYLMSYFDFKVSKYLSHRNVDTGEEYFANSRRI